MILNRLTILIISISGLIYSCQKKQFNDDRIKSFKFSECIENCTDPSRIIEEEYHEGNLKLSFGEYMNCGMSDGAYLESFEILGDTLNLKLNKQLEIQGDDTVYSATDCECYYVVNIELLKINKRPQYLKIEKPIDDYTIFNISGTKITKKISSKSDTVFSDEKIFISILPSNKYLDSIQKIVPEDEWNEVASDNEYYRDLTEKFLLKKGYRLADRPNNKYWSFQLTDGRIQIIDTTSLHDKWGNLIFNGNDSAFIFDSASPEIELKDKL